MGRRRRSKTKRILRFLFNEISDYDSDDKFRKKRDNYWEKRKKKWIASLPAPIFKEKTKKKKSEADGKKMKKILNDDVGSGSGAAAERLWPPSSVSREKSVVDTVHLQGCLWGYHQMKSWPSRNPPIFQPEKGWRPIETGNGGGRERRRW